MIDERAQNLLPVPTTAWVMCPTEPSDGHPSLLGLTIGSRLLHTLARAGVQRVLCLGEGPLPRSDRAQIEVTRWTAPLGVPEEDEFLVLPADLVFCPSLLRESPNHLAGVPIQRVDANRFLEMKDDPEAWITALGMGHAPPKGPFAVRVIDKPSKKKAARALRNSLRKDIDGFISKHLNRHISIFCTRFLVRTGLHPNFLTIVFTLIGIAAAVVATMANEWWMYVLAGFLIQAQSVLDGCDGEIARLTFRFSKSGQWLDTIGDDVSNYLFCLGLALNQAHANGWTWLYILGGITFAFQIITSIILYRRLIQWGTGDLLAVPDTLTKGQIKGPMGKILAVLGVIRKRDFFVFVVAILTAIQLPLVAFMLLSIGTFASFAGILINDIRISKRIAAGTLEKF